MRRGGGRRGRLGPDRRKGVPSHDEGWSPVPADGGNPYSKSGVQWMAGGGQGRGRMFIL